ncbi:MAG: ester cyclase [Chloroflexi bacterium]|nr:ester cyclase [Chloroflexota bacterium]
MEEENKAVYRRFIDEVMIKSNLAAIDEVLAPDFVDHSSFNPQGNREGLRQGLSMMGEAFGDAECVVEDLIAHGDKVVSRYTMRATHKGPFMGVAPTGKQIKFTGMEILRFADGKMVEHWEEWDVLGLLQQLGIVPPMDQA